MSAETMVVDATVADEINHQHSMAYGKTLQVLGHMQRAGELLLQAKKGVGHGGWAIWLTKNISFSERTAQNYMKVARHWPAIQSKSATVADLTLRQALIEIADKRPRATISEKPGETPSPGFPSSGGQVEASHRADHGDDVVIHHLDHHHHPDGLAEGGGGGSASDGVEVDHRGVQVQIYAALRDAWDEAEADTRRKFLLDDDVKAELLKLCKMAAKAAA